MSYSTSFHFPHSTCQLPHTPCRILRAIVQTIGLPPTPNLPSLGLFKQRYLSYFSLSVIFRGLGKGVIAPRTPGFRLASLVYPKTPLEGRSLQHAERTLGHIRASWAHREGKQILLINIGAFCFVMWCGTCWLWLASHIPSKNCIQGLRAAVYDSRPWAPEGSEGGHCDISRPR